MDQEGIRRKIESLLALAGSDNENEALAAAQAARRLMLKYHISMSGDGETARKKETGDVQQLSRIMTKTLRFRNIKRQHHHQMLARILSKNFRCRDFCLEKEVPGICFLGFEEDAYAALALMEYLVRFMEQGVRRYLACRGFLPGRFLTAKDRERCRKMEISWRDGFCLGVMEAFERQNREEPGFTVMLTVPAEVEAVYAKMKLKKGPSSGRKDYRAVDGDAFYYGRTNGKRAVDGRWISSGG